MGLSSDRTKIPLFSGGRDIFSLDTLTVPTRLDNASVRPAEPRLAISRMKKKFKPFRQTKKNGRERIAAISALSLLHSRRTFVFPRWSGSPTAVLLDDSCASISPCSLDRAVLTRFAADLFLFLLSGSLATLGL